MRLIFIESYVSTTKSKVCAFMNRTRGTIVFALKQYLFRLRNKNCSCMQKNECYLKCLSYCSLEKVVYVFRTEVKTLYMKRVTVQDTSLHYIFIVTKKLDINYCGSSALHVLKMINRTLELRRWRTYSMQPHLMQTSAQ